jgi:hypothetical protein
MSTGSGREDRDSIIRVATRMNAMIPSGMLIVKMDLQPKWTVRYAPSSGPTRLAKPQTPEKRPWMRARSSSEYRSAMTVSATGMRPAAPRPWIARAAIS